METPLNQKTVTLKLKRIEVSDLRLACTVIADSLMRDGQTAEKWEALHDKLSETLKEFDEKHGF